MQGVVILLRDLRALKALQQRVERTERLAAGVAHEIRNPLGAIRGLVQHFQPTWKEIPEQRMYLDVVVREVDRLNRVVSDLVEFARPREPQREPHDLPEIVRHAVTLMEADARANELHIVQDLDETLAPLLVDRDLLLQALRIFRLQDHRNRHNRDGYVKPFNAGGAVTHTSHSTTRDIAVGTVGRLASFRGKGVFTREHYVHREPELVVAFDPADFYTLDVWLIQYGTNEVNLRTAISRTYFAGHLLAVHRLINKGWEPKGSGDDHSGVIRKLREGRTRLRGDELSRLRELREHADYHLEASASSTAFF